MSLLLPVAPAPAATSTATIPHGDATGSWVFVPGASTLRAAVPRQSPAGGGAGWETAPVTGTVPAGTWRLTAELTTTVPAGTARGQVLAAVHAVGAGGSRLLGIPATGDVLGTAVDRSIALELPLDAVVLRDERIVVEWFLTVSRSQLGSDAAATSLSAGTGADAVTLPGAAAPLPLVGPTRAAVTDPQDHRLTVTWRGSPDPRVVAYEVLGGTADGLAPLGTVAAGDGGPYGFVVDGLANREAVLFSVVGVTADAQRSPASNLAQGRALDRTPPDAPGRPTAEPEGTGTIALSWPASSAEDRDGYRIERAATAAGPFVTIATAVRDVLELADTDLPPQTTWWYRVRAVDDDGLWSEPGETATTTTAPAVPTGLRVAAVGDRALTIDWNGTDRPLAGYRVERATADGGFSQVGGLVTGTSFTDDRLSNGTTYRYRVLAEDGRGVRSDPSAPVEGSPRPTPAPAPPTFLTVTDASRGATLEWGPSPSRGVVGYQVLRAVDGGPVTELGGLRTASTATDRDVEPGRRYTYSVVAVDADGRRSPPTTSVAFVLQPGAPRNLTATASGTTAITLAWDASSDASATYEVWRGEGPAAPALIARTDGTSFQDAGLLLETRYRYFVRAVAAGFRASPASNTAEVTLRDGPPSAPVATALDTTEGSSIEVRWQPPAERDVASWRVERRIAGGSRWDVVADVPQPLRSYRDEGLTDGVRYEYRLFAVDRGGAESPPSAVTSAVPSDTTPPELAGPPTVRLTIGALAVDWDVAPTAVRYEVHRSSSPDGPFERIATTSLRTIRDADVVPGETYHYRIVAVDEAGNASPPSPAATGTFSTAVSPGSVVPVVPRADGTAPPGGDAAPVPTTPPNPFDPTRPVLPPGLTGELGSVGSGVGGEGVERPTEAAPPDDGTILAFPPDLGPLRDAVSAGDLPAAVGRVIGEVAGNVPDVARTFSIPLLLVVVILLYLMAQGRIDRDAALLTVDAPAGGDEDDVEFLL